MRLKTFAQYARVTPCDDFVDQAIAAVIGEIIVGVTHRTQTALIGRCGQIEMEKLAGCGARLLRVWLEHHVLLRANPFVGTEFRPHPSDVPWRYHRGHGTVVSSPESRSILGNSAAITIGGSCSAVGA